MVCKAYVWLCDTRDNKGLWTTSALQAPTTVMLHMTLIFLAHKKQQWSYI